MGSKMGFELGKATDLDKKTIPINIIIMKEEKRLTAATEKRY